MIIKHFLNATEVGRHIWEKLIIKDGISRNEANRTETPSACTRLLQSKNVKCFVVYLVQNQRVEKNSLYCCSTTHTHTKL